MIDNSSNFDPNYRWYRDKATMIALVSGFFSFVVTLINALFRG